MLSDAERDQLKGPVLTMQIIVGALALGIVNFLLVVVFAIKPQPQQNPPGQPLFTYMAIGGAVLAVVASIFLPMIIAGAMRKTALNSSASTQCISLERSCECRTAGADVSDAAHYPVCIYRRGGFLQPRCLHA